MVFNNKLATALGIVSGLYIGIFGIPGLANKDDVQISQHPPAAEEVQQESSLERVAMGMFEGGVAQAATSGNDYEMPSDETLEQYLSQPVKETLGEKGVDYIEVTDDNYDEVVSNANTNVAVLFYNNLGEFSAGDAALAKVLNDRFEKGSGSEGHAGDKILFCAYKVTDGEKVRSRTLINHVEGTYPIDDIPAIAFYKNDSGEIKCVGSLDGGFDNADILPEKIKKYTKLIEEYLLD